MPLIKIEVPEVPPEHEKNRILTEASAIVSKNTGKPEQYIMVTLAKADFAMAGDTAHAAFVDVRGIGGINAETNAGISKDICALLQTELDIPPANIYLNFTDVPGQNWGLNGTTFS